VQTAGSFTYPSLASLILALQNKCEKLDDYQTDGYPLSLLLYYERQSPFEPFERLTDYYYGQIQALLMPGRFADVWVYHHASAYTIGLPPISGTHVRIPLRDFADPESQRAVIGHIVMNDGAPVIFLDLTFGERFQAASDLITRALGPSSASTPDASD
jgi:hypothetical protein